MSTVITTSVLPDSTANDTLTIGATGDSVAISGDSLNLNTLQDAGGNTIFVSDGSGSITSQGFPGALTHILSQTASNSASVSFTTGIDSTYDIYILKFMEINPASSGETFTFNGSSDGGSNYNVVKTSTYFRAYHSEDNTQTGLDYEAAMDLAQSTAYQELGRYFGGDSDTGSTGELYLFAPSSTTYVKHWYSRMSIAQAGVGDPSAQDSFSAGYFNTTSAVDAMNFKFESGNFDGTIAMYGVSKS